MRTGLRGIIEEEPGLELVGEAANPEDARKGIEQTSPDVVLLDIRLEGSVGLELIKPFRDRKAPIRFLALTAYSERDVVHRALRAGVDGFLVKRADAAELAQAIRDTAAGKSVIDPTVTHVLLDQFRGEVQEFPEVRLRSLSHQEKRVLKMVASGRTNREIAADMGLAEKTVKNYFSNVLEKLQLSRRAEAAAFFARYGGFDNPVDS